MRTGLSSQREESGLLKALQAGPVPLEHVGGRPKGQCATKLMRLQLPWLGGCRSTDKVVCGER